MTDYHELLARKDIDAVVLSLPDHQHAEVALRAVLAGKDIYLQKPFTPAELAFKVRRALALGMASAGPGAIPGADSGEAGGERPGQ